MGKIKFISVLILIVFQSCKKDYNNNCISSNGEISKEVRNLAPFTTLFLTDYIHVDLQQQPTNSIEIEGGKNLLEYISSEIRNDTLFILNNNKCNFLRSYKPSISINLFHSNLKNIHLWYATGNIASLDTIKSEIFTLFAESSAGNCDLNISSDSARISLQGSTFDLNIEGNISNSLSLSHTGLGTFNAQNLNSKACYVYNNGLGDIYINASSYIYAYLGGNGNIFYQGEPSLVQSQIEGNGKLIEME